MTWKLFPKDPENPGICLLTIIINMLYATNKYKRNGSNFVTSTVYFFLRATTDYIQIRIVTEVNFQFLQALSLHYVFDPKLQRRFHIFS